MPHLVVEYSANLEEKFAIQELVGKVHKAALKTGIFETAAVRTRAQRREVYAIADEHKDNSFVAVWIRVGPGRDEETRKRLGNAIFDEVCGFLADIPNAKCLAVSVEVQEINPVGSFRKNDLHALVKERALLGLPGGKL